MQSHTLLFAVLAWCSVVPLAASGGPGLYGLTGDSASRLLRFEGSGAVAEVGPVGFACSAMDFSPEGTLFAVCLDNEREVLVRIDRASGAAAEPLELTYPELEGFHRPRTVDLAFRRSDGALLAVAIQFPLIMPPGLPVDFLYRVDPRTGQAEEVGFLFRQQDGLAFDPRESGLYSTQSFSAGAVLQGVDPATAAVDFELPLSSPGSYSGLDFGPLGRLLWALVEGASESRVVTIDPGTGRVQPFTTVPFRLASVAWSDGEFPAVRESILPLLTAVPLPGGGGIGTSVALFNSSTTTLQSALEFFDQSGTRRQPVQPAGASGEGGLAGRIPRERVVRLRLSDLEPFTGWGRLTVQGEQPLGATATLTLDDGSLALRAEPLAQVRLGAVQPARRVSGTALIEANRESAFTLVNPSNLREARVRLRALRDDGSVLDLNEIRIPPRGQVSGLLWRLLLLGKVFVQPPERPDFQGQVIFESVAPVAVTGVEVTLFSGRWASIPLQQTAAP